MNRGYRVVRNCFCGILAVGLIASGHVRRARRRALTRNIVTAIYFHSPDRRLFVRCVRWLLEHGYTFISTNDVLEWLHCRGTLPRGAAWLSFDDGCRSVLTDVLPLAYEYKIPLTLFIPSGIISRDGLLPWLHPGGNGSSRTDWRDTLTVAELQEIATRQDITIGSHTVNHAITAGLSRDEICFELGESKRTIESWINRGVKCFAYPAGQFDGREKSALAECGYALAATTENAFITPETDPYLVPRLSIGDQISFPEAICNMVGVWRPLTDPLIHVLKQGRRFKHLLLQVVRMHNSRKEAAIGANRMVPKN
jgi:peptidoglycan/xylan/chitin deacetylase (PgdA/CDA1 family)